MRVTDYYSLYLGLDKMYRMLLTVQDIPSSSEISSIEQTAL